MAGLLTDPTILVFFGGLLVGLLATIIGCIIWFVRLEGRVNGMQDLSNERLQALQAKILCLETEDELLHTRITRQSERQDSMQTSIMQELNKLSHQVAELVGFLKKE